MSDTTDTEVTGGSAEGAEATGATEAVQASTTDNDRYDRLVERLDQLGSYTSSQLEALQQALSQQNAQVDDDEGDWLDEGDDGYEEQQFQRYLDQLVSERVEQGVQQAISPIQQARQAEVYDTRASEIEGRYRDLMDDKGKPTELAASVMQAAWESAERFGINSDSDPRFWDVFEMSYKAHKADEIRGRETAAGQTSAVLESGGASAGQQQSAEDEQQRLMERLAQSQRDPFA